MQKISVPLEFRAKVTHYFHKKKERWVLEYFLPSEKKIKVTRNLKLGTTESKARSVAREKESDLAKGLLTDKEYKKLSIKHSSGMDWTIEQAIREYRSGSAIGKTESTKERELRQIACRFRFFTETFGLKMIREITDEHLIDYKNHLIHQVNRKEIAPSSAPSFLGEVKKVFSWLAKNKKILVNPAKDLEQIRVPSEKKVRTKHFTGKQILQVMEADFVARNNFPIKEFFLFARETGARSGEILHLEWSDIKGDVWEIKVKPNCPTALGIGWKPKWGKERMVKLTPTALEILKLFKRVPSVGYVREKRNEDEHGVRRKSHPVRADFIFVVKDYKSQEGWRRVDAIDGAWEGLLEAAGLPFQGSDSFVRHDLRRTFNVEKRDLGGVDDFTRAQYLGHSPLVNNAHYSGGFDDEIETLLSRLRGSKSENLLQFIRKENFSPKELPTFSPTLLEEQKKASEKEA